MFSIGSKVQHRNCTETTRKLERNCTQNVENCAETAPKKLKVGDKNEGKKFPCLLTEQKYIFDVRGLGQVQKRLQKTTKGRTEKS